MDKKIVSFIFLNKMIQYQQLMRHIMQNGTNKSDRTWTWTRSIFGYQMRFDLSKWFPLITTKKMFLKWIIHELLRFLSWDTNIKYLTQNDVHIRDERPYQKYKKTMENNLESDILTQKDFISKIKSDQDFSDRWWDLGPVYWFQWRNFNGQWVDQIQKVINTLKTNPDSRRILVVAYNPIQADDMLLPPCHSMFQFYVSDGKLSCQLYQRSCDVFLGLPFNIASYSLLTMMIAQVCDLDVWDFVWTWWDTHIYNNHLDQVKEQLSRTPKKLPTIKINQNIKNIFDFTYNDFELCDYEFWPSIKAPISI